MADRSVTVRLLANVAQFKKEMRDAEGSTNRTTEALKRQDTQMVKQEKTIDRFSGRLRLFGEAAATLGPALVPLSAAAVPAIAGLTAGLGAAAGAAGVALLAFNGMGDALDALDAYQLEPTTANLEAMQAALDELGPAGAEFARYLDSLGPALEQLQMASRDGFPGMQEGIEDLLPLLPQVEQIISNISVALGDLAVDAGQGLNNDRFQEFFDYLETDAGPTVVAFGHALGNLGEGLASLMVGFAPLSRDFSTGLEEMTQSFADWAAGLSETDGFREFVAYVRESGPQALDALGSIAMALVAVVKAAAPFGHAVLPALTALANILAAVANSPVGPALFTAAAGLLAVNRASIIASAGMAKFNASAAATGKLGIASRVAGIAAAFGILGNEFAKLNGSQINLSTLDQNLNAIAQGSGADALDHLTNSLESLSDTLPDAYEIPTLGGIFGDTPRDNAAEYVEAYDQALASLVESGNAEKAAEIFAKIQEARTGLSADTHQFAPFGDSAKDFDAYAIALGNAAAGTDEYADATGQAAEAAAKSRTEIRGLVAAMEEQTSAALSGFDANTRYGEALAAAREQAKSGEKGLDEMTEAGRKNRDALSGLAAAWNNQDDAVRNNVGRFREARKAFIDTATAMGVPIEKARTLASRLLEIPRSVVTQVNANTDAATANLNVLYARLAELSGRSVTTYIDVVTRSFNAKRAGIPGGPKGSADGSTVPFGGPYVDRHPYLLAPGEEVISNRFGQADKNRGPLKAANRGAKLAVVGGMAAGGTAGFGAKGLTVAGPSIQFPGTKGLNIGESVKALMDLGKLIKRLNSQIDRAEKSIRKETKERDRLSAIVDVNRAKLEELQGLYANLSASIQQGLSQDLYAQVTDDKVKDVWRADKSGSGEPRDATFEEILARVQQDTANAQAFTAAESKISQFLSGDALESVIGSGDLGRAQMFANLTPAQLASFQAAFGGRTGALADAGNTGADERYGEEIDAQTEKLSESVELLHEQNRIVADSNRTLKRLERLLDKANDSRDDVKDHLGHLRSEAKKAHKEDREDAAELRGAVASGARGKR